jgi:hypothetical protein
MAKTAAGRNTNIKAIIAVRFMSSPPQIPLRERGGLSGIVIIPIGHFDPGGPIIIAILDHYQIGSPPSALILNNFFIHLNFDQIAVNVEILYSGDDKVFSDKKEPMTINGGDTLARLRLYNPLDLFFTENRACRGSYETIIVIVHSFPDQLGGVPIGQIGLGEIVAFILTRYSPRAAQRGEFEPYQITRFQSPMNQ